MVVVETEAELVELVEGEKVDEVLQLVVGNDVAGDVELDFAVSAAGAVADINTGEGVESFDPFGGRNLEKGLDAVEDCFGIVSGNDGSEGFEFDGVVTGLQVDVLFQMDGTRDLATVV